jgi:hypothetical protein
MRRLLGLAFALTFAFSAPAAAKYYINKPLAEHDVRLVLHNNYGYTGTGVYCQPKRGRNEHVVSAGRVFYHRWTCGWATGEPGASCKGLMSIIGSDSESGFYYYRQWSRGEAC